jgi:hypothetical protein
MGTYFEQIPLEEVKKITGIGKDGLPITDKKLARVQIGRKARFPARPVKKQLGTRASRCGPTDIGFEKDID